MTFQELMRIARTAAATASGDDLEAATRAVVTALRDEAEGYVTSLGVRGMFDRILASDGVEAAGGDNSGEIVASPAAAPSAQSDVAKAFEAEMRKAVPYKPGFPAAAPDVCEWTPRGIFHGARIHAAACDGMVRATFGFTHCPTCKRPIKFKEAAR